MDRARTDRLESGAVATLAGGKGVDLKTVTINGVLGAPGLGGRRGTRVRQVLDPVLATTDRRPTELLVMHRSASVPCVSHCAGITRASASSPPPFVTLSIGGRSRSVTHAASPPPGYGADPADALLKNVARGSAAAIKALASRVLEPATHPRVSPSRGSGHGDSKLLTVRDYCCICCKFI
jgi:hypothetical protein